MKKQLGPPKSSTRSGFSNGRNHVGDSPKEDVEQGGDSKQARRHAKSDTDVDFDLAHCLSIALAE